MVQGPYLVRSAELSKDGKTVKLTGDIDTATTITVFAPKSASTITWNGEALKTAKTNFGGLTTAVGSPDSSKLNLPALTSWKAHDSLPERLPSYDDTSAAWVGM